MNSPSGCSATWRSMPEVDSIRTPSGSRSPVATYSIAWVEHPHSGWIRNSASGCSARVEAMSSGRMIEKAQLASHERSEPHVGAEEDLGFRTTLAPHVLDHLDGVGGGAAVVRLGLHLRRGVHVHHHDGAG